ncbi:RHS repeat-associated core domain-containing protein [Pseudomonas brassicacearum]|uniref:RHS repeat-associated core domain-containing protein n=1 Tax=Pseudomonas brassicacearum TaxID=930166 RepID=UPI0012972FB5|nr:RHS repeat-associated core domain-containing protein [Pseudomonas brassicacearum]QGA47884.1 RHS domain-containing protein [Pseudomonas brassicacearum]
MSTKDRIAFVDQELATFKDSLKRYREQTQAWYAQRADDFSRLNDLPSFIGMERVIKAGDTQKSVSITDGDFLSSVTRCPLEGPLLIESKFESVYDIPIGDIEVEIVDVESGEISTVKLDAQGKARWTAGVAGKYYQIRVHSEVTPAQIDELFGTYAGLTSELEQFLRNQWDGPAGYRQQWSSLSLSGTALAIGTGILEGGWEALKGVWDGISLVLDILKDPGKFSEQLGEGTDRLIDVARQTPNVMKKAMLLASDEAALFLMMRCALIWLASLPPMQMAGDAAKMTTAAVMGIAIDIVIAIVLTVVAEGTGVIYLAARLKKYGEIILKAVIGFVESVFAIINGFMAYVAKYIPVAVRGTATPMKRGEVELRIDGQRNARLVNGKTGDDASRQATTPTGKSTEPAARTCTDKCPVSMVTGEELLTLNDGQLDGLLPFEWTRLYRTSAAEIDCGLGFGWSHALGHRLEINGNEVIWTDHENRSTPFPLPSQQRPAITNSLSRAAIYLGDDPSELIVAQAGERPSFYHFRFNNEFATLIAVSDHYGNRLHITRDILGQIKRLDNGAGRALLLRYHGKHIIGVDYQQFRPADTLEQAWSTVQTLVTYGYDDQHRLVEAKNAAGETEHYRYNEQHVIVERQLAGGASFFWEWENEGKLARCIHHWASFSQMQARYAWDDKGSVTVINADGSEEVYTHDDKARLVSKTDPDGAKHRKAYNEKGQLIAEKDPLGAVTQYRYDEDGLLIAVIPPEEEATTYEHINGFVSDVHRGKASWKYRRNRQGDITRQIDPDGNITYYHYSDQGRLTRITHPDGSFHLLGWNRLGQLLEECLPDGSRLQYTYDVLGRQISRKDETGAITQYQWDAVGRLLQLTLPTGATRAWSYNAYGKVTAERDELGRITRYEYANGLHLVSRRLNPDGSQLRYRYDNSSLLLTQIENERGEHYHLDYYSNGLIREEVGFDGQRTGYAYDLNGHLLEKTEFGDDGSQRITAYQRDTTGRLLRKTLPDGETVDYRYDALGRLVSVDDGHWPLAYEYDHQDRLVTEHQGWGTLRYEYDAVGQLKHCRLPDRSTLDYHHAAGGALLAIDLNGTRLTEHRFSGGRERQRRQGRLLSDYEYDEQGRLKAQTVWQNQQQQLLWRDYAYSANGNLETLSDNRNRRHYQYDPLDRLVRIDFSHSEPPEHFCHDPAGNLMMQDRPGPTTLKGNRLLMEGDRHYDYDAFGNLIRERRGTGQKLVSEYRYDCQHRLIGVITPDGRETSYRYDAFGRRISKIVDGQTTEFIWQGDRVVAESGGQHYRSYLYEPGTFRPLAMLDGEGPLKATPFYYHLDHLGTPQELTSYSGKVVWSARYNGYGKLTGLEHGGGEQLEQPLRFQGQYHDLESGLHYNRHRYYNPETGRYLTPDPIKLAGGLNAYQYVPNPTGWVDPLGLNARCPGSKNKPAEGEQKSEPPLPELSRHGAFRQAKLDAGVPKTQQPDLIYDATTGKTHQYSYARMTDKSGESVLTSEGKPILAREYQFTRPDGSKVIVQDHSAGHQYKQPGNRGDQKAHFNLRPIENKRTGKINNANDHYYFKD